MSDSNRRAGLLRQRANQLRQAAASTLTRADASRWFVEQAAVFEKAAAELEAVTGDASPIAPPALSADGRRLKPGPPPRRP